MLALLQERKEVSASQSSLPDYSVQIVEGAAQNLPQIDRLLDKHARGAGIDRLPAVDLAVLRVGVWELLFNQDEVPPITAIDEAVAVVKQISTDSSPAYVNAVLDAIRKSLVTEDVTDVLEEELERKIDVIDDDAIELDELLDEY